MNTSQSIALTNIGSGWARKSSSFVDESVDKAQFSLTAAAAGFLFSFRTILALISARWLNWGTEPGVIAGFIVEIALLLIAMSQAFGSSIRPVAGIFRLTSVRWIFLFLAFSCLSLIWSGSVSLMASFMYWAVMAADVAIVILLLRNQSVVDVAHSMMKGYIFASVMLAVVAWIMPVASDLRLGDQEYFNTNQIGNICAMGVFMAQFLVSRKDGQWRFAIVFLFLTLLRSLSKATLIAFIVSQVFMLILNKSFTRKKKLGLSVAAFALILLFGGLIESYFDVYTTSGNQAETLTGRTGIWIYSLNAGLEKPWIGNGIDSMWKTAPPFGPEMFEARHAENEILQQFFAYGLVGVAMLVGIYGTLYKSIRTLPRGSTRAVLSGLLLFILIRGLAEAEPIDLLLPLWVILLISTYVAQRMWSMNSNHNLVSAAR